MVAEAMRPGRSWQTRPDVLKADHSGKESDILVFESPTVPNAEKARQRSMKMVEAKKQQAIQKFQEKMAEPVTSTKPQLIEIRAGDVRFDPRYQTDDRYDEKRAMTMAENWDYNRPNSAITINIRPGDMTQTPWCPDGRHRTNAILMRFGPDHLIPAELHRVSYEKEAAMFAHQDENRKRVSEAQKFNAGKEAGEPMPLEAQAIADRLGLKLESQAAVRQVAAKTFLELVRMKGPQITEDALRLLLERYDGQTESLDARMIKGMTYFLNRYRDHPNFTMARLRKVLTNVSVTAIMQEASGVRISGEHKKIAAALVYFYNYKREKTNHLPEWGKS